MAYEDWGQVYEQKRRALAGERDATLGSNAYGRFLATQRGSRDVFALDKKQTLGLGKLSSGYFRRGMQNSGLFNQGRVQYADDWTRQRNDLMEAMRQQLAQYDLADANANAAYASGIADIDAQKLRDIMSTAAQLAGFNKLVGGS